MTRRPNILIAHGLDDQNLANIAETAPKACLRKKQRQDVTLDDMTWAEIFFGWPPTEFLKEAQNLSWVHLPSAGADGYANQEVYAHPEVILTNSSGVYGIPMAEHAFSMMLAFNRSLHTYMRFQQAKRWEKLQDSGELHGKILGILGLGDIGTEIALRAKAFGMQVWALKRRPVAKPDYVHRLVGPDGLQAILQASDYVIIALPLTVETIKLIGERELGWMQPHAVLINVGRGPIIDEQALIKALQEGHLAGAGLDVFEEEPLPLTSPLWDMPNVIITPHSGGVTPESTRRTTEIFCHNLKLWLDGHREEMTNVVNMQVGY